MTDWIEHNGGPRPIGRNVWVEIEGLPWNTPESGRAREFFWAGKHHRYRILNEHLIKAARLEGIRLGLEAAKRHADACVAVQSGRLVSIPSLDPATIAREATDKHDTKRHPAALIGHQEATND